MIKTKIEWCDYTINPVKGLCRNNCWYCYAKKMYKRFGWDKHIKLDLGVFGDIQKLKKPSKIFVGSMHDIFGSWIPWNWIMKILDEVELNPEHTFIFLTKFPERYLDFNFPKNCWLGETIDGTNYDPDAEISHGALSNNNIEFVSFEPLIGDILPLFCWFDWIIVGGLTGGYKYERPDKTIKELIGVARKHNIPIFIKDNLKWHEKIQEFPKEE